jgi:hypothetical protein
MAEDIKKMVLGNIGKKKATNPFKGKKSNLLKGKKKNTKRKKKGNWDVMYGGQEGKAPEEQKPKKRNFWVDTTDWFSV